MVSPKKNLWHCLGACSSSGKATGGTVIDWVMKTRGVSFRYAVELLRTDHPSLAASGQIVGKNTATKLEAPVAPDADDQAALRQVADYYHETLKQSAEALAYLQSRRLTHPEGGALPPGLCESHAELLTAGEEAQSGGGDQRPSAAARRDSRYGP